MRVLRSALAISLLASGAHAQVVKPETPETKTVEPKQAEEADDSDDGDGDNDDSPKKPGTEAKAGIPAEVESEEKPLPPPPPPRADEQEPRPYLVQPKSHRNVRHVELGPDLGLWSRPAKNDSASYASGFAWGLHARIEILPVLGFSAYGSTTRHSVTMADTEIEQPPLQVFQIGARVEPTWPVMPTLRLWLGLGVAWGQANAPSPTVTGLQDSSLPDRSGVFLEYSAALGGTYDVIPNWLALSLSVSGGAMANQSGDMFDDTQAMNNNGLVSRLPALPEMESSFSALLGVGMIL